MKRFLTSNIVMISILALTLCVTNFAYASSQVNLNLTQEQIAALKELKAETRKEIKPLVVELVALRDQIAETILAGEMDTDNLVDRIIEIRSQITEIINNAKLEAGNIISGEQAQALLEQTKDPIEEIKEKRKAVRIELNKQLKELRDFLSDLSSN
jgi:F0F1-type ATP synthase membrane subunit b/b'